MDRYGEGDPGDRYRDGDPGDRYGDGNPGDRYGDEQPTFGDYDDQPYRKHEGLPQVHSDPFADDPFQQQQMQRSRTPTSVHDQYGKLQTLHIKHVRCNVFIVINQAFLCFPECVWILFSCSILVDYVDYA
jgi:hypothetical protein